MFGLPFHLIKVNRAAPVNVIHLESPGQFLFWGSVRRDVKGQHELAEVYCPAVVSVECSKYIFAKLGWIAAGKHLAVHLNELLFCQLS